MTQNESDKPLYWLSFGGGVNSTALAVLLCQNDPRLAKYTPWRIVFADTYDEQDKTYDYIDNVFRPYLRRHGKILECCCDSEGVFERWRRLSIVGHRIMRTCTSHAKIRPLDRHRRAHTKKGYCPVGLVGIDAGEAHRAKPRYHDSDIPVVYPLVDMDIDRDGCVEIIKSAGLPIPRKSGCWHCPFLRVKDILVLARERPDRMKAVIELEAASLVAHPIDGDSDGVRAQWGDKPASEWAKRACREQTSGELFQEIDPDPPCACYDGV